jgi:hemoglobin-like flavoprotein
MALDIDVLERSFARVKPRADQFAADFYADLFARNPQTQALFTGTDMTEQRKKLMDSLVLVIENLENPDVLTGALRRLGQRHTGYGVVPDHYGLVGASLLATFEKHLGPEWTPGVRQAWVDAYGAVTQIMLDGAPAAA